MLTVILLWCIFINVLLAIRLRSLCLASPIFTTNLACLLLYITPLYTLPWNVEDKVYPVVEFGIIGFNVGLLLNLSSEVKFYSYLGKGLFFNLKNSTIDYYNFCVRIVIVGMLLYGILFVTRGIPVFSDAVDLNRSRFLEGSGYISVPATTLIMFGLGGIYLTAGLRRWLIFTIVAIPYLMLSGWRGYIIFSLVPLLLMATFKKEIKARHFLIACLGVFVIAFVGILRAQSAGGTIYGIDIEEEGYLYSIFTYLNFRLGEHYVGLQNVIAHYEGAYLYGAGALMDISPFFPLYDETLAKVMARLYATWTEGGAMTITMLGGFFADFGLVGVFFGALFAAYCFSRIYFNNLFAFSAPEVVLASIFMTAWLLSFMGTFFAQFFTYFVYYYVIYYIVRLSYPIWRRGIR